MDVFQNVLCKKSYQAPPADFCAAPNGAPFEVASPDLGLSHCRVPVSTTCYKKVQARINAGAQKEAACRDVLLSASPDDWQCRENCKNGDGANFAPKKPNNSEFVCNKTAWGFFDAGSKIWATVSCAAIFNTTLFTKKFDSVPLPNPELNALATVAMTKNPGPTSGLKTEFPCIEYNDAICPKFTKKYVDWLGRVTDYPAQCRTAQYWNYDNNSILGMSFLYIFFSHTFTFTFFAHMSEMILDHGGPLCREDHQHTTTTADLHCTSAVLWSWSSHLH